MKILNFAHPLTPEQIQQLSESVGAPITQDQIVDVPVHFDTEQPFAEQVSTMLDDLKMTTEMWQTTSYLIVLPSLNYITAVLLAELHGRIGHFPSAVRLKPKRNTVMPEYEVAEILFLNQIRDNARGRRY